MPIQLEEIQEIDAHEVIKAKLIEAQRHHKGLLIVEDTSLYLDCLNGLPGPLIKWFEKTIGNEGLYEVAKKHNNFKAQAKTIVGYFDENSDLQFFSGTVNGNIVSSRGSNDFGWAPIFELEENGKTFAQMMDEEKNICSMRTIAFEKMKDSL